MSEKKPKWLELGSVLESDGSNGKPKSLYIKVKNDITLKKGQYLNVTKPSQDIDRLVDLGYITIEEAQKRKEAVPAYVKLNISVPPAKE